MKLISRLFATSAIRIRHGTASCVKGGIMSRQLADISSVAGDFQIERGEIWINPIGRVDFSKEIPEAAHQRIRNVLAS